MAFGMLAATFDYPDILRRPTDEVLARSAQAARRLVLLWWVFAMTAVALAPTAVLLSSALDGAERRPTRPGATIGVLAALVQFLGLIRWPFLVPYLARIDADPEVSPARREAIDIVFQSFNRYLGVAVGEHLGYLLTGGWSVLSAPRSPRPLRTRLARDRRDRHRRLARHVLTGVRRPQRAHGWKLAGTLTPIAYIAWSLWLMAWVSPYSPDPSRSGRANFSRNGSETAHAAGQAGWCATCGRKAH